jgi:ferrous iron transport protein B
MKHRKRHRKFRQHDIADGEKGRVLLVGNPNVGKSVIFSYLTGRYSIASNYPGTTVEISAGVMGPGRGREVVDTPGINSLLPRSEDEKVTRDIILAAQDAIVVQVADAKNLFRALLLTSQLAEIGCRMILVLNMMDEARQRGFEIDTEELSSQLGIDVIEAVAVEKVGLSKLAAVINGGLARVPEIKINYSARLVDAFRETGEDLGDINPYGLFGAQSMMTGGDDIFGSSSRGILREAREKLELRKERFLEPFGYAIAGARKDWAEKVIASSVILEDDGKSGGEGGWRKFVPAAVTAVVTAALLMLFGKDALSSAGLFPSLLVLLAIVLGITIAGAKRMGTLTLHPVYGYVILVLVLYMIYMFVGVFAAGTLVDFFENGVFGRYITPAVGRLFSDGFLKDLFVGDYGLVSMGITYAISIVLPIVVVFFLIFGVLEDTGYFPRLTVLTNNGLKLVGVNGKATLPFVLGFGCVTMAVLSSRILETRRERIIVIALLSLAIPCSAQLGVIMALLSAVSLTGVLVIGAVILIEFVLAGMALGRLIPGRTSDFMLELPPLRNPRAGNVLLKTKARAVWFLKEALPFFLAATVVLFILDKTGAMNGLHRILAPVVVKFLGLPVESAAAFILGFFRRDYGAAGLFKLWQDGLLDGNQVVVSLVVMSLFIPCLATVVVTIKELGIRMAAVIFFAVLSAAVLTGGLMHFLLNLTGARL